MILAEGLLDLFSEILEQKLERPSDTLGNLADLIGPTHFSEVAADIARRIAALDRYERRALSRRKFAIRELDAARNQEGKMRRHRQPESDDSPLPCLRRP
jgi:hypothetical protein